MFCFFVVFFFHLTSDMMRLQHQCRDSRSTLEEAEGRFAFAHSHGDCVHLDVCDENFIYQRRRRWLPVSYGRFDRRTWLWRRGRCSEQRLDSGSSCTASGKLMMVASDGIDHQRKTRSSRSDGGSCTVAHRRCCRCWACVKGIRLLVDRGRRCCGMRCGCW